MIDYSQGYRNIVYNARSGGCQVYGWDQNKQRIQELVPFNSYVYVETNSAHDGVSIFGKPLRKIEFDSDYDRKKFVTNHSTGRVYYNLNVEQQFALDYFGNYVTQLLTQNALRCFYIDIEVYSKFEFPVATQAKHPVNIITVYDSLNDKFHSWGVKPFNQTRLHDVLIQQNITDINDDQLVYRKVDNETELFNEFLRFWTNNFPDMLTGWNIHQFDVPYIINRLTNLFGENAAKLLSPVNMLWKMTATNIFKKPYDKWNIRGVSIIDYMELYRSFSRGDSDSYKLGDIGVKELNINKSQSVSQSVTKSPALY